MAAPKQNTTKKEQDRIGLILYCFYIFLLFVGLAVFGRMLYIMFVWEPDKDLVRYFVPPSTRSVIEPKRGAIIGCDGKLLALSTPMYDLYMDCTVLKKDFMSEKDPRKADSLENDWLGKARRFTSGLSAETGINADEYYRMIVKGRNERKRYMKLLTNLDRGTLLRLEKLPLMEEGQYKSGLIIRKRDTRQYPYGMLARRTIGYVKDNRNQKADERGRSHIGIEGKYDYVLHGKEGEIWLRPTDNREKIQNYDSTYVKPEDGLDVRTTLDITLQDIVDKALRRQIQDNMSIDMGCAVIMDVKTGAIRAMVNLTRDSTDMSLNETYNMAIGLASEPGSVFKTTTLMTALEDGVIKSLDDRIPTNNGVIPGYKPDTHVQGMKDISILRGFEISSNYVFRYLAVNNYSGDPKKFLDKLYLYKMGQAFDFDLDGLTEPELPSPDSPKWSATDLGSVSIGYAVKETPLHILTFYNAIANKGRMMKPYLVESIERNGSVKTRKGPSVLNASICSKATADTLLRAMRAVTSEGTATRLKGAKLKVAGKTGTSRQVLSAKEISRYGMETPYVTKDGSYHNLATFVGFFPADAPKYSAVICVKSGLIRGSVYGGVIPAAAMREIVDAIYALGPEWGTELNTSAKVPKMTSDTGSAAKPESKNPTVPNVMGLGLKDAMYVIENSGFRCKYTGTGHVVSQNPRNGQKAADGSSITITLK